MTGETRSATSRAPRTARHAARTVSRRPGPDERAEEAGPLPSDPATSRTVAPSGTPAGAPGEARSSTSFRLEPGPTLIALGLALAGFLLIAVQLYVLRFDGSGPTVFGVPSRVLFVVGLTLVASPLVLAVFRRPPLLFVLPSIALVFLLYPLFSPFGVPFGQDAIFNFQFASSLLGSGQWTPGAGVSLQAVAYSYYPASGVFNAELSAFTGVPLYQTFQWGVPLLRLLILPLVVYDLGRRFLGPQVGLVGVLVFLATPSILFNYPVQSEFAIPFFALALVLIGYLLTDAEAAPYRVVTAALLLAGFVVVSHHFSSYTLAAWLALLLGLWVSLRRFSSPHAWRAGLVADGFFAFLILFTVGVSLPNFDQNYAALRVVLGDLLNPGGLSVSTATSIGSSFPQYMLIWSYLAYAAVLLVSMFTLRRWLRSRHPSFLAPNLLVAVVLVVVSLPMLVTAFGFLAQRVMEYGEIFMAPAAAWWITRRLAHRTRAPLPVARWAPSRAHPRALWVLLGRYVPPIAAVALIALIFTGASLVPFSTRDQFASPNVLTTESPLNLDRNSYALGVWAHTHLTSSTFVWGDTLTLCVFGGFGQFEMAYDQYLLFNGTTIPLSVWSLVHVGSYVVVDRYMVTTTPQFPGPSNLQPTAPLTPGQLEKFNDPAFFDLVYQDATFTVYLVSAVP